MSKPVIIVVPREKFTRAAQSLRSLYTATKVEFELIYIETSGGENHRSEIRRLQREFGFELIILEKFLYPNAARNLGLERANRYAPDWVAFVDNDVLFAEGWLGELVRVGTQKQAGAVTPLICQNHVDFREVHTAGGVCRIENGALVEVLVSQGQAAAEISPEPVTTELIEFHCVLLRHTPELKCDPKLLNTREHIDLSLQLQARGESIYLAPRARVAYLPPTLETFRELLSYELRWSNVHKQKSLEHFARKWNVTFESANSRNLNAPRRQKVLKALETQLSPYVPDWLAAWPLLMHAEPRVNRFLGLLCTDFYDPKYVILEEYGS